VILRAYRRIANALTGLIARLWPDEVLDCNRFRLEADAYPFDTSMFLPAYSAMLRNKAPARVLSS
jgi:hypothetical protein